MPPRWRLAWIWFPIVILSAGSLSAAWFWLEARNSRLELDQAHQEIEAGRYYAASQRLEKLAPWRSQDELGYLRGVCDEKLGKNQAALLSWSQVSAASKWGPAAATARGRLLKSMGRFTEAEDVLRQVAQRQEPASQEARRELELIVRIEGRNLDVRRLIVESWSSATDHSLVLKRLFTLEDPTFNPTDFIKQSLKASTSDDDRARLGQANLALWEGRLQDAGQQLALCRTRQPDDSSVWASTLNLAIATQDFALGRSALSKVPAALFLPAEILRLQAWLARSEPPPTRELQLLDELLKLDPANALARARLAEHALKTGQPNLAEQLRIKQSEMNTLRLRYATLIEADQRLKHVDALLDLSQKLGRPIEARGWRLIRDGTAKMEQLWPQMLSPSALSLADLLARTDPTSLKAAGRELTSRQDQHPSPSNQPPTTPHFEDRAEARGLRFFHDNGHTRRNPPPTEAMCGGVALLDYDGDGWLDVYAVQGGAFPPSNSPGGEGDRLFRNRGNGTFDDVTEKSGIAAFRKGYGNGVSVGDYDNNGYPDLLVTRWLGYALYRNNGEGRFEDVTEPSGLGGDRDWPTSSAFADLDGDGDLDLYVCHYLEYNPLSPKRCEHPESPGRHECMPLDFPRLADHVFRNDHGRFIDVTAAAGFVDPNGRGLGVVAANLDDDQQIDLYVANDMTANYLFRNLGGFRFDEVGQVAGVAASADGLYKSGMGIACADLNGKGRLDLAVTNYFGESTSYYRNVGAGFFVDDTAGIGLMAPSRPLLGFGIAFLDANNDGRLDLLSVNGHVLDGRPRVPWMMPMELLTGDISGRLTDVTAQAGKSLSVPRLGRGLAVGDLDNDGRDDAVVLSQNEPLIYLHNETAASGHYLTLRLEGLKSNRDAVGARVTLSAGGRTRMAERIGGGSYQSASDPRIRFGLDDVEKIDSVEIRWPSGHIDRITGLAVDAAYVLREGDSQARLLWKRPISAPGQN